MQGLPNQGCRGAVAPSNISMEGAGTPHNFWLYDEIKFFKRISKLVLVWSSAFQSNVPYNHMGCIGFQYFWGLQPFLSVYQCKISEDANM